MKTIHTYAFLFGLLLVTFASGQNERKLPIDTTVISTHTVTVKGKKFNYTAEPGPSPFGIKWVNQLHPCTIPITRETTFKTGITTFIDFF